MQVLQRQAEWPEERVDWPERGRKMYRFPIGLPGDKYERQAMPQRISQAVARSKAKQRVGEYGPFFAEQVPANLSFHGTDSRFASQLGGQRLRQRNVRLFCGERQAQQQDSPAMRGTSPLGHTIPVNLRLPAHEL